MCLHDGQLSGKEEAFRYFFRILDNTYHFNFHEIIERLKDVYAPIDPDADTCVLDFDCAQGNEQFIDLFEHLLEKANYERLTEAELEEALSKSDLFNIPLTINLDNFSDKRIYYRGVSTREEKLTGIRSWFNPSVSFTNYDRVVLYIRYRDDYCSSAKNKTKVKGGTTLIKMFRNVPKQDIEMVFPDPEPGMRGLDKALIGLPAIGGGAMALPKLITSLTIFSSLFGYWFGRTQEAPDLKETTTLVALMMGIGILGAYLWKLFNNFKNGKVRILQELLENLYFKNMDNNSGVFFHVGHDAAEEECKEALLAYYFLLTSETALTMKELDDRIEAWMKDKWNCVLDFEVDDALPKLLELKLATEKDGKYSVVSIEESIKILDDQWDAFFNPLSES
ncbi:MAG: DUF3754 domain-containing protein [Candidatus Hydrogenedentales bacterium]|jgi:hypothetical protein